MDEPLINYQDLLDRVKKAVPFFQGDDDQQIVISYRHIPFQTFINIDRNESLHVSEAFGTLRLVDQKFTDESI